MAEPPPAAPPAEYPLNIAETHKSRYALTTYHERLGKEGPKIFQKNQTQHVLYFWDLPDDGTGVCTPLSCRAVRRPLSADAARRVSAVPGPGVFLGRPGGGNEESGAASPLQIHV